MAKLTRSGIAHDLSISPHQEIIKYNEGEFLTFVFSSDLYRRKFNEKQMKYREYVNESLSKRFGFTVINNKLADIKLYAKTETRGFLIKGKHGESLWLENIILNGETVTNRN